MERMKNLYEEHDGEELKQDPDSWTMDYVNKEIGRAIGSNFSKERVHFINRIGTYALKKEREKQKKNQ